MENQTKKEVVFSAIQPSGTITLGNLSRCGSQLGYNAERIRLHLRSCRFAHNHGKTDSCRYAQEYN